MPFGIIGRTGPGMRRVVGFWCRSLGRGTFEGEFGTSHCNQWELTFAATRPSSRITLGRLVVVMLVVVVVVVVVVAAAAVVVPSTMALTELTDNGTAVL